MNCAYCTDSVSQSLPEDASYRKYLSFKSAQTAAQTPVRLSEMHDVVESTGGAFTARNLAAKTDIGGDITGKVYLRSIHGCETPYAVQFYFERTGAPKYKGELLRIFSRTVVHLLDWKKVGDSLQAELSAAAWVTVHDGHDFSARVLIRITVDPIRPDAGQEIEVLLSADNRRYTNTSLIRVIVPRTANGRGAIRMARRVALVV